MATTPGVAWAAPQSDQSSGDSSSDRQSDSDSDAGGTSSGGATNGASNDGSADRADASGGGATGAGSLTNADGEARDGHNGSVAVGSDGGDAESDSDTGGLDVPGAGQPDASDGNGQSPGPDATVPVAPAVTTPIAEPPVVNETALETPPQATVAPPVAESETNNNGPAAQTRTALTTSSGTNLGVGARLDTVDDAPVGASALAVVAPEGDTPLAAAVTPGTPAPAPLRDQPGNVFEALVAAPAALASIAITAVNAFLGSILAPGPATPAPPVMLFVVLGWVQRELQRTFFNQSPTAVADSITTAEGTGVTVSVLANDVDPDVNTTSSAFPGDTLTVTDYTQPNHGVVTLNANGTFTYTPEANFAGTDTFGYTVSDEASPWHVHGFGGLFGGGGHASSTIVTVTVTAVNDAPVAVGDGPFSVGEDGSLTLTAADLVGNDTDPDGGVLHVGSVSGTANTRGTVVLNANGSVTYTPAANYNGPAEFTYTVADASNTASVNAASVSVTVTAVNDAPVAVGDGPFSVNEDGSLTLTAADLVGNDTDPDGGVLHVGSVSGTANTRGTVVLNANGSVTYTPAANYNGPAEFTYTVADASNAVSVDAASVSVTVTAVDVANDGPVVVAGQNASGQTDIPAPPPGLTYTDVEGGYYHTVLLLSDGTAVSVGNNGWGQGNIPALPPNVTYTDVAAGYLHTVLLRSDGTVVAVGDNGSGETGIPALPPNVTYTDIAAGGFQTVLLRSDGTAVALGDNTYGQTNIPPLPPNVTYTGIAAGANHTVLLRSDGTAVAVGNNEFGQTDIPALPPNVTYVAAAAGNSTTVLLRSDGTVVAVGWPGYGQTDIPVLPQGMTYTDIAAGFDHTVLLRSDGTVVTVGRNDFGQTNVPAPSPGVTYTNVAVGDFHTVVLTATVV